MENYIYLSNYNRVGDLGLSKNIFISIGHHTLTELNHILNRDKNVKEDYVQVTIKDGKILYKFYINITEEINKEYVSKELNLILANNLLTICDSIPFDVSIKFTVAR